MAAWIKMIKDDEADEGLLIALDQAKTPHGTVDNVMRVHSLRPSTMKGHLMLYRSCLHDSGNTIPEWLQEVISSYVSIINSCEYSLQNHWKNATHLINDEKKSSSIKKALLGRRPEKFFSGSELAMLNYAEKLTCHPTKMEKVDVDRLKEAGICDGEILEVNQIVSYFNYVNRTINGLGVTTKGDKVGYYIDETV